MELPELFGIKGIFASQTLLLPTQPLASSRGESADSHCFRLSPEGLQPASAPHHPAEVLFQPGTALKTLQLAGGRGVSQHAPNPRFCSKPQKKERNPTDFRIDFPTLVKCSDVLCDSPQINSL